MRVQFLFLKSGAWSAGLVLGLCLATIAKCAVGFSICLSSITNDYVGEITLTVTGLTPGQTVTMGIYADLNGNGTLDPGEPLVWSIPLTDGQAPQVAGVRYLGVPGDEDGLANGTIRSVIYIPPTAANVYANGQSIVKVDRKSVV